ncbi:MAG: hypothetical protein HXS40_01740 [Theionarchaea archaeon]|nr:hypothetical protein [Theionarchaea archaeon]
MLLDTKSNTVGRRNPDFILSGSEFGSLTDFVTQAFRPQLRGLHGNYTPHTEQAVSRGYSSYLTTPLILMAPQEDTHFDEKDLLAITENYKRKGAKVGFRA